MTTKSIDVNYKMGKMKAENLYIEPGGLYQLHKNTGIEMCREIYANEIINSTKYYRIMLYEWFLALAKDGILSMHINDNEILSYENLFSEIHKLNIYKGRFEILEKDKNKGRIIIQKIASVLAPEDDLNSWTFGIVTNGKRLNLIEKSIESIRSQKIRNYEIIICGTYDRKIENDIRYIKFSGKDDKGWITKKKNLICENAKYENICVIHDRIFFDKEWFTGMKKWGNYFEVLSCPLFFPFIKTNNFTNWETVGPDWKRENDNKIFHTNGKLHESDWDPNVYIGGAFIALKKSVWDKCRWNENLFWGDAEDIEYSQRLHQNGIMLRFNPYAKVYSQTVSGIGKYVYYEKDIRKLGKFRGYTFYEIAIMKLFDFAGLRRNQKIFLLFKRIISYFSGVTDWRMTNN